MTLISAICRTLRPHHYIKNTFIFLPAFFSGELIRTPLLSDLMIAFCYMCLLCSSVYILNDIQDIARDQQHPEKKYRPIASGAISVPMAWLLSLVLMVVSISGGWFVSPSLVILYLIYLAINLLYSFSLKQFAIIDVCLISVGFVIRLYIGALFIAAPLSNWIVLMTFLLALFLSFAKRYDDILIQKQNGNTIRRSLDGYNQAFIQMAMGISAGITIVSYAMYTTSPQTIAFFKTTQLFLTIPFVLMGILRYFQLTMVLHRSGSPVALLFKDLFLQVVLIGWIGTFGVIAFVLQ